MSKGIIDGIIHSRLIIQNLLKAFKKVPRRYVSNTRGCQSGTSYRTNNAVVCCLLCREGKNVHSSAFFESALYLSYKNVYKTREISVAPLSVVSVLGCTWYTTLVIPYILDSAFLVS